MKTFKFIPMMWGLIIGVCGCFDSSVDVNWQKYNEVMLFDEQSNVGTENDGLIEVYRLSRFTLSPKVTQSLATDDSNLKYSWRMRPNADPYGDYDYEELATTKDLDIEMTATVGLHRLIFSVTDTITGVSKYLYYDVQVLSDFSKGWLILENTENGGDLAMLVPSSEGKDKIYRHIYSTENDMYLENPVGLMVVNYANFDKVFMIGKEQGYELTREEFTNVVTLDSWFVSGAAPATYNLQCISMGNFTWYGLINDGLLYSLGRTGGTEGENFYFTSAMQGPVMTDPYGNEYVSDYYLAPFAVPACSGSSGSVTRRQIVYDDLNRRFMYAYYSSGLVSSLGLYDYDSEKDPWDPNHVDMTMLHVDRFGEDDGMNNDSRKTFTYNAIMRDDQGNLFLLQFDGRGGMLRTYEGDTPVNYSFAMSKAQLPADFNDFEAAASSKVREHMYISAGSKLYHYDILSGAQTLQYTFAGSEHAVLMRTAERKR